MPGGQGLIAGAFSTDDDVLGFFFNPEMWRIIGQIRDQSHERSSQTFRGAIVSQARGNLSIEVWDYRQDNVRRMFFPVRPQYANDRTMIDPDRSLQNNEQLWR